MDLGRLLRSMVQTYPNLQPPVAEVTLDLAELVVLGNGTRFCVELPKPAEAGNKEELAHLAARYLPTQQ